MDRVEKPRPSRQSEFANEGEVNQKQAAELASPTGREDHLGLTEVRCNRRERDQETDRCPPAQRSDRPS